MLTFPGGSAKSRSQTSTMEVGSGWVVIGSLKYSSTSPEIFASKSLSTGGLITTYHSWNILTNQGFSGIDGGRGPGAEDGNPSEA